VASDHLPVICTLRVTMPAGTAATAPYVTGDALPPVE
jgi:hypothetical protein